MEFELPADLYEDEYRRLILSQNSIGWKHLFMGRFSNDWAAHQDDFYFTNPGINPKKRRSGERWQVAIIGVVWESWNEVWKTRNQDVHGADATQTATIERRDVLRSLRRIYDKRRMYEPSSQELLMKDIRDHEGHTTRQLKNWLAIAAFFARRKLIWKTGSLIANQFLSCLVVCPSCSRMSFMRSSCDDGSYIRRLS